MQVAVTGKNIEVTEGLRSYAQKRAGRLSRLLRENAEMRIVASVHKGTQVAEVTVHLDAFTFRAEGRSNDMYRSIDAAFAKLRRQIVKLKDRWQSHGREETAAKSVRLSANALAELQQRFQAAVAATKTYTRKPMTLEEACMQLELRGVDFLPFVNAATGEVHVLYRLGEDQYGVVDPEGL